MNGLAAYDDTTDLRWYRLAGDDQERCPDSEDPSEADDDFDDDDEDPEDADEDELEESPDDE